MSRLRSFSAALAICGLGIASDATAIAAPALSRAQAVPAARLAVSDIGNDSERHRPRCSRVSASRFGCTMRWRDNDGDYSWNLRITITRTDPAYSPVDLYRVSGTGTVARDRRAIIGETRRRVREIGRIIVDTRRARLGQTLPLVGQDHALISVTAGSPIDPVPTGEFDQPPTGTRYLGVPLAIKNDGVGRFEDTLRNGARLVMADGATINADVITSGECRQGSVDVPANDTRLACVAFPVPLDVGPRAFEYRPDSGYAPETGEWSFG